MNLNTLEMKLNTHFYKLYRYFKVALCTTEDKWYVKKMRFKITVYLVTSVYKMVLNIVSTKL